MEKVPAEILFNIVSHVYDDISSDTEESDCRITLTPLACISRRWQHPYLTPARLSYIRSIYFDFIFPHDHFLGLPVFHMVIKPVLILLAQLPYRRVPCVKFTLHMPDYPESNLSWWNCELRGQPDRLSDALVVGYGRTFDYLAPSNMVREIPDMPMVYEFTVAFETFNLVFEPCSMNQLAGKMTRLQKAEWCLSDNKINLPDRQKLRSGKSCNFADTLNLIPRSIETFSLRYLRDTPRPRPRSIVPAGANGDVLSQALRRFTQRDGLLEAFIEGSFDETIIWPGAQPTLPRWPTLQKLYVDFHPVLPSGECIVKSVFIHSLYGTNRIQAKTDRLLLAAGQGAHHMPEMKWMGIGIDSAPVLVLNGVNPTCGQLQLVNSLEIGEDVLGAWQQAMRTHRIMFNQCTFTRMRYDDLPDFQRWRSELSW
ncbi:hypothetical protein NM208_g7543 [Fusarium decemcellulare]|uniref:Uncharacterized protein n=1 Tax=Fusarium decemcellulare TaxID=57161 RepID=A0ACC1S8Y7_9HYPO|nr:hypothetical protein NM208_g7543 [Fusarium decemcellulare]